MPNWCVNTVVVRHSDPAKIEELKSVITNDVFFEHVLPIGDWEYNKAIDTWGTKWEASNLSWMKFPDGRTGNDYLELSFETAWCPPENVYAKMVENGWKVEAYFYEPGMGFVGKYGTDLDGLYEESYQINEEPIPAELVEMFNIQDMFDDSEYELVDNGDGFYEVQEIDNAD